MILGKGLPKGSGGTALGAEACSCSSLSAKGTLPPGEKQRPALRAGQGSVDILTRELLPGQSVRTSGTLSSP